MKEPLTTTYRVYRSMRDMIISGELPPGTRLVQRRLAERFGTSNIPIVESIRRLERDGMVVCHPNWGALVRTWSIDDIEAMYLTRAAVEGIACRLFVKRATELDRVVLAEYARQFDDASRDLDVKACNEADIALHMHIVKSTRSEALQRLVDTSCLVTTTISNNMYEPSDLSLSAGPVGVHDLLLAALNGEDQDAAERAGREHLLSAYSIYTSLTGTRSESQKTLP